MPGHLKRLFNHSIVYGLAETVSRGTGFVLMFLYLRVLTEGQIGIRSALYFASALLSLFYTLGLENAFLRYYMDSAYANRRREIFSTALWFTIGVGVLILAAASLGFPLISSLITNDASYSYATRLLFMIMILDAIGIFPTQVLRAEQRFVYYSTIQIARFVLFILSNILFVWMLGRGVDGVFEANLLVAILVTAMFVPLYLRLLRPLVSTDMLRKLLLFGVPTIFTLLAMRVIDFADRRIILQVLGPDAAGRYAAVYTLGMVSVMVFVNSFRIAWQPFFLSLKDDPEHKAVFASVARVYCMAMGFILVGVTLFRREIFRLYAPSGYSVGLADIIPFVAFSYIVYGIYLILLPGVFFRERTIWLPLATVIGAIINIALNFALIPRVGIIGAAYTTIFSYLVMVGILYAISRRIYRIDYKPGRIGIVVLITAVPIVLGELFRPANMFTSFALRAAFLILPLAGYWYAGAVTDNEQALIRRTFLRWFNGGKKSG